MSYAATVRSERFTFADLRDLFAKANEVKSGDQLAGVAAATERERVAAKLALADVPLVEIVANPMIDDDVTRLILDGHDLKSLAWAVTPEIAAAAAKLMGNKDLILAAGRIRNVTRCRNTLGGPG